ncbi:pentapeptide repeat-containing protein [Streptomyces fulvoviolaceus]|uniref:pentapeptide repeat-containing protein n=1 Tax=Streptomyces fulvoviolaceus TaxID=285535 RepID=UPI0006941C43|nr:pentapeptide repeat-containing protein [Streptomyces fulvoviolaceus]
MKTHPDTPLGRLALAAHPSRPWLHIQASPWWRRVLLAAGARQASWAGRALRGADLYQANLIRADLTGTCLADADLDGADLSGAFRDAADLSGAHLDGVDLTRARLTNARLSEANLGGADLVEAILYGADLTGANLTGADLCRADMIGTYLTCVNLDGADLSGAYLVNVTWSEQAVWPDELAVQMRARSVPLGRGKWRVEGSGNSGADVEVPLVPAH